jgi:hypothetical protein
VSPSQLQIEAAIPKLNYANAVEAEVKALNGLVRLRGNLEFDGTTLMERAFSLSNPVLKFNDLLDQLEFIAFVSCWQSC